MNDVPEQIGKYRIERELGRGAMGVVYQAFDPVVERHVALKTIRFDQSGGPELLDLLKREAKSVGRFEHPNIITLYDAGEADGLFYMVMQLVQGETLRDRLCRQRWYKVPQVVEIFRQILAGLGYAHERGVVHRDIKPANIMISADGAIKVADFGIAKLIGPGTSSSGLVVGTPSYMSPEQVLSRPVDARSDLFSVGCTLYEVLTGEKAFPGDTATAVMYKIVHEAPARPAGLRPGIDPGLEQVVLKALANDPDDRFSTCRDMAKALEDCVAGYRGERAGSSPAIVVPVVQPVGPSVRGGDGDRVAERRQSVRPRKTWAANSVVGLAVALGIVVLIGAAGILARRPVPTQPPARRSASTVEIAAEPAASAPVVTPPPAAEAPKAETKISRHEAPPRAQAPVVSRSAAPLKAAAPAVTPLSTPSPRPAAAPDSVETFEALMLRGDVAFQQSAYDTALASYLKANRLKPGDPAVRRKLKVVLTLLGRPAEALNYR